jgi:hypothetical protein
MASGGIHVNGYREFLRACAQAETNSKTFVRARFREVGDIVRDDASRRFSPVDAKSAAGYRSVVRQRGVSVEQRYPRTTGQHPEFGAMQIRMLESIVEDKASSIERKFEEAVDDVADHFDG